jgi:ubiquinone/menaquinone biosynthesis C-methylase UbiE
MIHAKKTESKEAILSTYFDVRSKTVVDTGCGEGDLTVRLSEMGANAVGIDKKEIIAGARKRHPDHKELFKEGLAATMSLPDKYADAVLFMSSFHHIDPGSFNSTFTELSRVLKDDGIAIIIEPLAMRGSFWELTRLAGDEKEILASACKAIQQSSDAGFKIKSEHFCYIDRTFDDFKNQLQSNDLAEKDKSVILNKADAYCKSRSIREKVPLDQLRLKSFCRVNVLNKARSKS